MDSSWSFHGSKIFSLRGLSLWHEIVFGCSLLFFFGRLSFGRRPSFVSGSGRAEDDGMVRFMWVVLSCSKSSKAVAYFFPNDFSSKPAATKG